MALQIGGRVESDFTQPLGMMRDCHRRVEHFLEQLLAVAREDRGGPMDAGRRAAFDTALRYFRTGAPLHTADEEESLFPRLRGSTSGAAARALAGMERLEHEHRHAQGVHAEVDAMGTRWLETGELSAAEADRLVDLLAGLRETYRAHIAYEDEELFPLAAAALDEIQLSQIGREMALRRGLDPDRLPSISRCASRRLQRTTGA